MNTIRHLLQAWLLLACALPASGQPLGLSLPVINNTVPGQIVAVPLTVTNFDSVVSAQFVISWDSDVLSLLTVTNFNLPNLDIEDFNFNDTSNGVLRFLWLGPVNGATVPNGSAIYLMLFQVVGSQNSGSAVSVTELPPLTFFEMTKANGEILEINDVNIQNGFVAVGYAVGTKSPQTAFWPVQVYPNPVTEGSKVYFELEEARAVSMEYFDGSGRLLSAQTQFLFAGKHGMEIAYLNSDQPALPCFLVLRSGSQRAVLPLLRF